MLSEGLGVEVIKSSDTCHGCIAHEDKTEWALGTEVVDGHDFEDEGNNGLEQTKEKGVRNTSI